VKKHLFICLGIALLGLTTNFAAAQSKHGDKETRQDISRHRAMAAAHEGAAKCLEGGKKEDVCMKELLAACKGLAIGKYCGMKHEH
jgi:hypothetical protein